MQHYFIPGAHNNYRPHFLRLKAVSMTAALVVLLFVVSLGVEKLLVRNPSPQIAAIIASVLVDLANADRGANSVSTLSLDQTLVQAAQRKADDMAARGYFSHNTPEGKTPWRFFQEVGYDFRFAGENLAVYFSDSSEVERAWMNSPSHRANILNGHFTEIGIALAEGTYQGHPTTFVVQMFGAPARTNVASALVETSEESVGPSRVAGAQAAAEPLEVIAEDETFIAVKKEPAPLADISAAEGKPVDAVITPKDSLQKTFWKFLTSPKTLLEYAYLLIGTIVLLALILLVFLEIRRQSPMHIAYGVFLLLLMGGLIYIGESYISGTLLIL